MDLNNYKSAYIDQPGQYDVRITVAQNDYTKNGKECVAVKFETNDNRTIGCSYVEAVYFKLFRLAQSAGITEAQRANFEPKMLIGKRVRINVTADDQGRINVAESFAISTNATLAVTKDDMPF